MKSILYIFITITLLSISVSGQKQLFQSLTVQDGLSDGDVNCIIQDQKGFLWIGTESGLNRYDGYEFKVFKYNHNNPNSISHNSIWSLYEDRKGNIWIGTKSGELNKYSPDTETFTRIKLSEDAGVENSITSILEDLKGNIWIGTYSKGLYKYNTLNGDIKNWHYDTALQNCLSNNYVTSLEQDNDGGIWISTYNGLNYINPVNDENKIITFKHQTGIKNSLPDNLVWKITKSVYNNNLFYLCTASGLYTYNIQSKIFDQIKYEIEFPSQFSKSVAAVAEDRNDGNNILWIATYGGIFQLNLDNGRTKQFFSDKKNISGLLSNQIDQLLIDNSGVLWLVTDKGLNFLPYTTKKINSIFNENLTNSLVQELLQEDVKAILIIDDIIFLGTGNGLFTVETKNENVIVTRIDDLKDFNIWSLEKGKDNSVWIGTYGKGLFNYDLSKHTLKKIPIISPTFVTSAYQYVKSLNLSRNGTLWIGFWGGGLATLNTNTSDYKIWINNLKDPRSISYNDVWCLHEDKFSRLWIGTNGGGINLLVPNGNGEFIKVKSAADNTGSLLSNNIQYIYELETNENNKTNLLVCTENGINKVEIFNKSSNIYDFDLAISNFSEQINLPDVSVKSILHNPNEFWMSTNKGIFKYDEKKKQLFNYGMPDGCNSVIFNSGAYGKLKNGTIVFGSVKGPAIFNPSNVKESHFNTNVVLTDLLVFNKLVTVSNNTILEKNIGYADKIQLANYENVFTIKFASVDYNSKENIKYAYQMEGFDKDWIYIDNSNSATYTNLDPGTYIFKVKGTNSDGNWSSNEASIKVIIKHPWWRTGWAFTVYFIVILIILFFIRKFEINRAQLRNELKNLEFETKKQKELETLKSRFFANISHEFRTPLLLIKGPLEQMMNKKGNADEHIKMAYSNTERLKSLIDQLLDLSKLESHLVPLNPKIENVCLLIKGLSNSFKSVTDQKNIKLSVECIDDDLFAFVDLDKFEKIINNLLSNAFKFTPDGGAITVSVHKRIINENLFFDIKINDNGIGIPEESLPKIFDRFYQVDDSSSRSYAGSGIGLALVKELVELHKWEIKVISNVGVGTEFTITLPGISNADFKPEQSQSSYEAYNISSQYSWISEKDQSTDSAIKIISTGKQTILLVEDSKDVRVFVKGLLIEDYNIIEAENGDGGIKSAINNLPDLIISDVMMPVMDGFEFCKKIKTDLQTSHIPVILLTAKAAGDSKIEGLETGADDYLTKPFNSRELLVRIKNLLDSRKILKEKFSKEISAKPENITVNKLDEEFLSKVFQIAEKNIDNPDFDSEQFASEMFLSRSQFHRKLQAITGQAPGEFLRIYRLKKAAVLLKEQKLNVTQIAYEVGFNSPSHFTKAFKQMFNCLPSEFIDRNNL